MEFTNAPNIKKFTTALWVWALLYICAYIAVLSQFSIKPDIAILTEFAQRMLNGEKIAQDYYETNPPLSMIIFIPTIWIKNLTGLAIYHAHLLYMCLLIAGSFTLTKKLLAQLPFLDPNIRNFALLTFLIGCFIIPAASFGDREHFIILGLIPFLLTQATITAQYKIPRPLKILTLTAGTIAVLIKPHYGLIPVAIMCHRIWIRRDLSIIKDADFIALTLGVLTYAGILITLFPDFLTIILPDVINFYIVNKNNLAYQHLGLFFIIFGLLFLLIQTFETTKIEQSIINWLTAITLLLLIPYLVQAKGYDYHKIPWLFSYFLTCGLIANIIIRTHLKPQISWIFATFILIICTVLVRPLPMGKLTHDEFKALPLSQALNEYCPNPCRFLFLNDASDLMHELSVYHNARHASRFTSMWYLMPLIEADTRHKEGLPAQYTPSKLHALKLRFTSDIVEDFQRHPPNVIITLETPNIGYPDFNFIEFFSIDKNFKAEFAQYKKIKTLKFKREIYYRGFTGFHTLEPEMEYSIYIRKDKNKTP